MKHDDWEKQNVGTAIHKVLNETLSRKLTVAEYKQLIALIGSVFTECDIAVAQRDEEVREMVKGMRPILWNDDPFQHHKNIGAYEVLDKLLSRLHTVEDHENWGKETNLDAIEGMGVAPNQEEVREAIVEDLGEMEKKCCEHCKSEVNLEDGWYTSYCDDSKCKCHSAPTSEV